MIRKITLYATLLVATIFTNQSHALVSDFCGISFIPAVQRSALQYTLRWDAFDTAVHPNGLISVTGTGPVPLAPFAAGFPADIFIVTRFQVFINETFVVPAIWTITGSGFLFNQVGSLNIHPDGVQSCSATGTH